ncbi:hypothetical protein JCM8547_007348 [Rhodosporidiobolus lusitaniae]
MADEPPAKRRRSSLAHPRSPSPPPAQSHATTSGRSPEQGRWTSGRPRIAGFDDEEDQEDGGEERSRTLSQEGPGVAGGNREGAEGAEGDVHDEEHCAICLSPIENKTVVYPCHHGQFCWNCIRAWTDQSRKCPLCLGPIEHLIHNIRSSKDYQIHYLLPLSTLNSTTTSTDFLLPNRSRRPTVNPTLPRHALYGRNRYHSANRINNEDETTWREREEERALERRRYIYREGLYAKHVASNRYTGFKPFTPQTFASNPDMKSKVIKFVRRELQIFPTVDISFLTTYLISIASQLDLRSQAAIRLISDFLSEQDAQHLVHEITTFARSPFTSLEGYDRYVQYGRPEREKPKQKENEELLLLPEDDEEILSEAPRFAENMRRREEEERAEEEVRGPKYARPPPPMATLPPRPTDEVRRGSFEQEQHYQPSQEEMFRRREGGRGYSGGGGRGGYSPGRGRSPSPGPSPRGGKGGGRNRSPPPPPPPREPSWRDRDERYTGSYYVSSSSRRDGPAGRRGGRRGSGYGRGERERSRSRGRYGPPSPRRRGYSRSPAPRSRSRSRSRYRSPSPGRRIRSPSRSQSRSRSRDHRSPSPRRAASRSPSPSRSYRSPSRHSVNDQRDSPSRRGRSRSVTPVRRTASLTPPPPPADVDSELEDAISLAAPSISSAGPSRPPSAASQQQRQRQALPPTGPRNPHSRPVLRQSQTGGGGRPTLNIFGAARKIMVGNGQVVTIRRGGGPSSLSSAGASTEGAQIRGKGEGRATEEQEPYDAVPASRGGAGGAGGAAGKSLLSRLGAFAPASPASPANASTAPSPPPSASTAAAEAAGTTDLRSKLQARLMAEYRQALASRTSTSSTSSASAAGALKKDLLAARLQAEKDLASSSSSHSSRPPSATAAAFEPRATFSAQTRDLLMARLEEERHLALAQQSRNGGVEESYGDEWDDSHGPKHGEDGRDGVEETYGSYPASYAAAGSSPSLLSSSASTAAPPPPANAPPPPKPASTGTESALRAALLAKRQAAVEDELKKRSGELKERLMRQKLEKLKQAAAGKGKA